MKRQKQRLKKKAALSYSITAALVIMMAMAMGCSRTTHVARVEVTHSSIHEMDEDTTISTMIQPYKEIMDAKMSVVIGRCAKTLEKGRPESTMGNWVADLLVERASAKYGQSIDFAIQNQGGLRINALGAGDVTLGKLYELMPFDNLIVVLHMKGDALMEMFDHMAQSRGWPISSEVRYTISNGRATDVYIHGKSLQADHVYKFALPDYIANGGDRCTFLADAEKRVDLDYLVRDAIIDQVRNLAKKGREIESKEDGRVTDTGNE